MISDFILNGTSVSPLQIVIMLVFLVISALLSLTVHEYGHDLALRSLFPDRKPSLNPLKSLKLKNLPSVVMLALFSAAWTDAPVLENKDEVSRGRKLLIAVAGPLANLVFAFLCIVICDILTVIGAKISIAGADVRVIPWISSFFSECVIASVVYAVFDLIPVPRTDGGMIVSALLPEKASEKFDSFRYSYILLFFFAVLLMRSGITETVINGVSSALEAPVLALLNLIFPV